MTDKEDLKYIECCDDRFEIIKRAREHIINATNIESSHEEMKVLDNFLFRCWQMDWLKNDSHQLEKENAELKKHIDEIKKYKICPRCTRSDVKKLEEENAELKEQIENYKMSENESKEIIAELKADKEWLDNTNNEQTKVILELQDQIEKMKNCCNCKYYVYDCGERYCKYDETKEKDCEKRNQWELAE